MSIVMLCAEHQYLGGRMDIDTIIHYLTMKPCTACFIDAD